MARKVEKIVLSVEQAEGAGARVRRSIGRKELRNLDPFLLLDEFELSKPAGFPDHPHQGFETMATKRREANTLDIGGVLSLNMSKIPQKPREVAHVIRAGAVKFV